MRHRDLWSLVLVVATAGCVTAGQYNTLWDIGVKLMNKGGGGYDGYEPPVEAMVPTNRAPGPALVLERASAGLGGSSETGFGLSGGLGVEVGRGSVSGQLGYARLGFEGGHDNLYMMGVRGRRDLTESGGPTPFLGARVSFVRESSLTDVASENPSANGFLLGGQAGVRLPAEGFVVNVFAGADYFRIGDFTSNGALFFEGGSHHLLALGVEIQRR